MIKGIIERAKRIHGIESTSIAQLQQDIINKLSQSRDPREQRDLEGLLSNLHVATRIREDGSLDPKVESAFEVNNESR